MEKETIVYVLKLDNENFLSKDIETGRIFPTQYFKNAYLYYDIELAYWDEKHCTIWGQAKTVPVKITLIE